MDKKLIENAKDYVNKLLLPLEDHYYHSYEHALDVMARAVYLAEKELLNNSDVEILAIS
jgi:HD superfamily phosphodiesterase